MRFTSEMDVWGRQCIDELSVAHAVWLFENFSTDLDEGCLRKAVAFWLRCVEHKTYREIGDLFGVTSTRASQLAHRGFVHLMVKAKPFQMVGEDLLLLQRHLPVVEAALGG